MAGYGYARLHHYSNIIRVIDHKLIFTVIQYFLLFERLYAWSIKETIVSNN